MATVRWTLRAQLQFLEVVQRLDALDERSGRAILNEVTETSARLEMFPHMGRTLAGITDSVREVVVRGHRLIYLVGDDESPDELLVVGFVDARRSLRRALRGFPWENA